MDYVGFMHTSPKTTNYGEISKKTPKLIFSGNFTQQCKQFDILSSHPERRASMKRDILDAVARRTEALADKDSEVIYEDPRDVIGIKPSHTLDRPPKPPRKRHQGQPVTSSPRGKDSRSLLREERRKWTKKYEGLVTALMDRCEESVAAISEKENQIAKLKDKLKNVLDYNKLFADENDQLKSQHNTLVKYIEECKQAIRDERGRCDELERRRKELEERVKKYEVPGRDSPSATAIPLVEVCMSCSSRQILLTQARDQNARLQKDMAALKDVLYRLNLQLSRYQARARSGAAALADGAGGGDRHTEFDLDSLIAASLRDSGNAVEGQAGKAGGEDQSHAAKLVDLSGLLSAQALAPLFDAYQENLQEKDSLILDYEKQFEAMNKKSKQIVSENRALSDRVSAMEEELAQTRQGYKKMMVERETFDIEKATLVERAERAESKLKEVYELYEDKMSAMMRDYETVHREYFAVRTALEASESRSANCDLLRARTVPADLHERRLEHCKRLLEELKHQYSMESERRGEQMQKLQLLQKSTEEKYNKLCAEHELLKEELQAALKNVKLYRKAAVIFRHRLKAAAARAARRGGRARNGEPLRRALDTLERIKSEIKVVKSRAHTSLEELERRIVEQERKAARAHAAHRRELERANAALEHKEGIIRSLIDKVADVEEVRLSQTNTHRLQGIVSDSERSSQRDQEARVKLVPSSGGYYQEKDFSKKKGKT